ncbi:threonine aldolase family protein, partial [Leucobacter sp. M11]|uniref:threonine aldolase family protein n=1 Tax=Leucobacter sp. M11 TaxID=2993565 RepID=UPI002D80EBEA
MNATTPLPSFASDNYSGAHPAVFDAMLAANAGPEPAYGDDSHTARFAEIVRGHFGPDAQAFPVFNGTGANVLALQAALPRWGGVICADTAHINTDENAAPERVGGMKLLTVPGVDGKITPELIERHAWGWGDQHRAQALAVSISQSTEFGTAYAAEEIRAIADAAHRHGMVLHMDGSRLSNAAAHLGAELGELTTELGVDLLSLGGTKNGILYGEAVVVLTPGVAPGIEYLRKINLQLGSKMRFLSAQLNALYGTELWRESAAHANAMATRLRAGLAELAGDGAAGIEFLAPTEANAVFARLPEAMTAALHREFHFYDWPGVPGAVRLMCAFDTREEDVDALL